MDGKKLHGMSESGGGVAVDSWCVTRADLIFLRAEVKKAIANGQIKPTELDNFDVADHRIGPNMHTLCAQYMQPLTQKAGSMSWALMRNPEGLKCDLFITHGWIEGIFEFIDKVVYSWPVGKKAAYICVLSNPQNLDIASLIQIPRESPFAKSLESATHMLVVPNHSASIYSRLWCVYEAWLAYSMDRVILTATAPIKHDVLRCLRWQCLFLVMGLIVGISITSGCTDLPTLDPMIFLGALAKLVQFCKGPDRWWCPKFPLLLACNCLGSLVAGVALGTFVDKCAGQLFNTWQQRTTVCLSVTFLFCFLLSEVDRVRAIRDHEEAICLSRNFTSVQNADCSSPGDAVNIRQEIQQDLREVDEAIVVLRSSGMSTRALRAAFSRGADVRFAGTISCSNMCFGKGVFISSQVMYLSVDAGHELGLIIAWSIISLASLVAWIGMYHRACTDQRAFAIAVNSKFSFLMAILLRISIIGSVPGFGPEQIPATFVIMIPGLTFLNYLCGYLGLAGVARIPFCGPWLASLLGPSTAFCWRRRQSNDKSEGEFVII
ncbi:unnamed protein product [Polarella glacialis]|uniref:Uncharacterized protein n=1 Tax=Polarella glacialis TaxID=89957 RepID=A0A813E065_POLGL|nr:unnamed protein product [Polarella glacialis]